MSKNDVQYLDEIFWITEPRMQKYSVYINAPILYALSFFGFPLHRIRLDEQSTEERSLLDVGLIFYRCFWVLMQILMVFSVVFNLANSMQSNDFNVGFYTLILTNVMVALISYIFLCCKETDVVRLMEKIDAHWDVFALHSQREKNDNALQRLSNYLTGAFAALLLAICLNSFICRESRLNETEEAVKRLNSTLFPYHIQKSAIVITGKEMTRGIDVIEDATGILLHLIFCEAFNQVYVVLACHIATALRCCLDVPPNQDDNDPSQSNLAEDIMRFKICHIKAYLLIGQCDDVMYMHCFLWVVNTMSACFAVYTFKSHVSGIHHYTLFLLLLTHLLCFVAIAACTAEANSQITDSIRYGIPGCEEAIGYEKYDDKLAITLRLVILYLAKMTIEIRGITVGGLFNVERGLILTIVAAILTYSIIVYDMGSST